MRLIITVVVCSLLTVGGFFGYKQYQRAEMKQNARDYAMVTVTRTASNFDAQAEPVIVEYVNRFVDESFQAHYRSGGLTKPAEFSDVAFSRDLFERVYNAVRESDDPDEVKRFARNLYAQTRPMEGRGLSRPSLSSGDAADDDTDELPEEMP